eukprot:3533129-Pyramimonas_sp.AAC.1
MGGAHLLGALVGPVASASCSQGLDREELLRSAPGLYCSAAQLARELLANEVAPCNCVQDGAQLARGELRATVIDLSVAL